MVKLTTWLPLLAATAVFAHPGEEHDHEDEKRSLAAQRSHTARMKRGLDACATHPNFLALKARGAARRAATAKALRKARSVTTNSNHTVKARRDDAYLAEYASKSHNYTTDGYNLDTSSTELFANYNNVSCGLTPKVTEGPYYVVGEYYRSDITDSQTGVPLHVELEFIDINTCDGASGIYVELWHANATGVYSGVVASSNGAGSADQSNLNATFLRGVQQTADDGVVAFDSIFPGHYTGRATHIHLLSHNNGTVLSNGTFSSATVQSVGQLGFDQSLVDDVSAIEPYASNTQSATENTSDSILNSESDENNDPFASYAYLGDSLSDGLLAWAHVGYDSSASYSVSAGAYLYASGGVSGSSSGGGGGGPGGSAPSGAPSGGMPSGGMPSGAAPGGAVPSTAGADTLSASSSSTTTSGSSQATASASGRAVASNASGAAVGRSSSRAAGGKYTAGAAAGGKYTAGAAAGKNTAGAAAGKSTAGAAADKNTAGAAAGKYTAGAAAGTSTAGAAAGKSTSGAKGKADAAPVAAGSAAQLANKACGSQA